MQNSMGCAEVLDGTEVTRLTDRHKWHKQEKYREERQWMKHGYTVDIHGSVVKGPRCSEGREKMPWERWEAKGSQRKPEQKAEEVPTIQPRNTLNCCWIAEVSGEKGQGTAMFPSAAWRLQHFRSKAKPCKTRQLKYLFDNLERAHFSPKHLYDLL